MIGRLARRKDGWWITDLVEPDWPDHGPYDTKNEALEDQKGLSSQWKTNKAYWKELRHDAAKTDTA